MGCLFAEAANSARLPPQEWGNLELVLIADCLAGSGDFLCPEGALVVFGLEVDSAG